MDRAILEAVTEKYEPAQDNAEIKAKGKDKTKLCPPAFSEDAMALELSARHADKLRYVAEWNTWLRWDNTRWARDKTITVFDLAREICRAASAVCNNPSVAKKLASAGTVAAVERLARSDRRHAIESSILDAGAWLINTPDGTIDLRTGKMKKHDTADLITKSTAVGPSGECPRWLEFIDTITGGDRDLAAFLQRMIGYGLTGSTREHALFFLYGTGANGKSVFLGTIAEILADYHLTSGIEVFTETKFNRHPTELANLRGARIVTASETEAGRQWAESRIKMLTAGDRVSARVMRGNFFEFTPEFKLMVAGNHRPRLRNVDEAMRRRLHLIPFAVTIPEDRRDLDLPEKLKAEWPGILAWMIEGAMDWYENGLQPPECVIKATVDYLSTEDAIAAWLEDKCRTEADARATNAEIYASWKLWCEGDGKHPGSSRRFIQSLEDRGFTRWRSNSARGLEGLCPKFEYAG